MDDAWERAVEVARKGEEYEAVRSLTLDGAVKCSQGRLPASALLEQFSQLRALSIANVGLASLLDFPSLPYLERLVLSDNRISGGLDALVDAGLVSLRDLDLSNSNLQTLEDLSPLAKLNLLSLDLYECPVTRISDYREKVFSLIKSLQYLDKVDAEDNERPESEEDDDDDDDEVGVDVDGYESASLQKSGATHVQFHNIVDDEDGAGSEEECDESNDDEEESLHYNGKMNHTGQNEIDSGSEEEDEDEDNVGDGDAVEVHDIEEAEEDEEEDGDEDEVEGEEDEDDDENVDEEGTKRALSLEGEIDAENEARDGENSELGDADEAIEQDSEDDEDVEYNGSSYSVRIEDEEGSDVVSGDDEDEDDDEHGEDIPAIPCSKRKRSKDKESDDSDDERPPKH